jgi:hypothetical protein
MANQGIMHLSFKQGGLPFCNTRRSIMSTTPELSAEWPRICTKCEAALAKMRERAALRDPAWPKSV